MSFNNKAPLARGFSYEQFNTCMRLPIEFNAERALREVRSIPNELYDRTSRSPTHKDVQAIFIKGYPPRLERPDDDREILQSLPYISSFIKNSLPGISCKCMIAALTPNGIIPVHSDAPVYSDGQPVRAGQHTTYLKTQFEYICLLQRVGSRVFSLTANFSR